MHRPDSRHASNDDRPRQYRPAPVGWLSVALVLAIPALVVAALLPSPAAFVAGAALGLLAARR